MAKTAKSLAKKLGKPRTYTEAQAKKAYKLHILQKLPARIVGELMSIPERSAAHIAHRYQTEKAPAEVQPKPRANGTFTNSDYTTGGTV